MELDFLIVQSDEATVVCGHSGWRFEFEHLEYCVRVDAEKGANFMMNSRIWLLSGLIGVFLFGSNEHLLAAAKNEKTRKSPLGGNGDVNVINSQVVINGELVAKTDSGLVVGNGRRVTKTVPVATGFHGINLSGVFDVEVVCGSATLLEVLIDENLLSLITPTVQNGILSIRFAKPVQTKVNPHLKIVLPLLDVLQLSGGDTVHAANIKGKSFSLNHEGTGEVTLSGQVEAFSCAVSGIGEVDAGKLACRSAEVSVSGVGGVTCRPESKLKVSLSGIGGVRCLTQPATVEKQATGLGDIEFIGK